MVVRLCFEFGCGVRARLPIIHSIRCKVRSDRQALSCAYMSEVYTSSQS